MEMEETPAIDEVPTVAFVVALKRNVPPAVKYSCPPHCFATSRNC
jgi:hypothetical protein